MAAVVCVRLGFWQLSRWREKQELNAALERDLAAPPLDIHPATALPASGSVRVRARGHYDESQQLVLTGRLHEGAPGVGVVTALVLEDSVAVLVDRGWLEAPDGMSARVADHLEPGEREVVGVMGSFVRGGGGAPLEARDQDGVRIWMARRVDLDSISARLPYRLLPGLIVQLPGESAPPLPIRSRPARFNESLHLGYAIQWFAFAAISLGGIALLTRRGRSPGA